MRWTTLKGLGSAPVRLKALEWSRLPSPPVGSGREDGLSVAHRCE